MSTALYFNFLLEDDKSKFLALPADKKMHLIIQMIKRKTIKNYQDFKKGLEAVGWVEKDFLQKFKDLWDIKKVGWDELDALDTNDHVFAGPGFLSDRWLTANIGARELCNRIPSKHWPSLSYCKDMET